jgi:hypothetical protein
LSYLFGRNFDLYTDVSYLGIGAPGANSGPDNFLDRIPWIFNSGHDATRNTLIKGYDKIFENKKLIVDDYSIYNGNRSNDNFSNFNNKLRSRYENSFVEIVTESSFASPGYMLTEKTMHSFYACNFPIILAGAGAVSHLRDMGFDMFDDIIDHGYDLLTNPIDRITNAIDLNEKLFYNSDYVKNTWAKNKQRFVNNVEVANSITDYYSQRVNKLWYELFWK